MADSSLKKRSRSRLSFSNTSMTVGGASLKSIHRKERYSFLANSSTTVLPSLAIFHCTRSS